MKMINFEKARARKHLREKSTRHLPEMDDGIRELQRQYREMARYYNRWYDEHVVGQDEDGYIKIYKILLVTSLVYSVGNMVIESLFMWLNIDCIKYTHLTLKRLHEPHGASQGHSKTTIPHNLKHQFHSNSKT